MSLMKTSMSAAVKYLSALRGPAFKAFLFGVAWYFLPTWLFIGIGIALYFIPLFQTSIFLSAFVGLLVVAAWAPAGVWYAVVLALLFGWLLSIKDLMLINRHSSYEMLVFAITFFLFHQFYVSFGVVDGFALLGAFFIAAILGWMVKTLFFNFSEKDESEKRLASRIVGMLTWQVVVVCLFLPLDITYQSVIAFLLVVPTVDILSDWFTHGLSPKRTFLASSFSFVLLALILVSAVWKP